MANSHDVADLVAAVEARERDYRTCKKHLLEKMTRREQQIALLLCEGRLNKQIADQLSLTEGTVKTHLHNIYDKLGVSNRTALAALVVSIAIN